MKLLCTLLVISSDLIIAHVYESFSFMAPDMQPGPIPLALPQYHLAGTPHPISGNAPESPGNVAGYEISQPTPPPATFAGQYCRGSACQYRVPPPPVTLPPVTPFPNVPYGLNQREFCRGLSCFPQMGWPANPALDEWNMNCAHLFDHVGGGLKGDPGTRSVNDVRESFVKWCVQRIEVDQVGKCHGPLADIAVMAVSPTVTKPTTGNTLDVCNSMFLFDEAAEKAFVDLKLLKAALPTPPGKAASLLSIDLNRFGTGGVGPDSPRGRAWKQRLYRNRQWLPQDLANAIEGEMRGAGKWTRPRHGASFLSKDTSLLKDTTVTRCNTQQVLEGPAPAPAGAPGPAPAPAGPTTPPPVDPEDAVRGTPKYDMNPPCVNGVDHVSQADIMYEILPGSPDGTVPNVEISGDLFVYCKNQMGEIMAGFPQTGEMTVTMTKDWCSWQASMTDWIGQKDELGHPDWDHRTCDGMALFMAFALRNNMKDGLTTHAVCQKLFLAKGAIKKVNKLVKDAWVASLRAHPDLGLTNAVDEEAAAAALQAAQKYAASIFGKLREQKKAFDDINSAKMDTSSFDSPPSAPQQAPAPGLPNSADFDMKSFIFLGSELKPWGEKREK